MNKKGFTLIEILAVIVIIGIVATIGVVSISSSISQSRDSAFADLAKTYAEAARTMRASELLYYEPKDNEAVLLPYSKVEGSDIENKDNTGYGDIIPSYCYIGIVNNNTNYSYYITQVDDSYHILNNVEYNSIDEDLILVGTDQLASQGVRELKAPFSGFSVKYGNNNYDVKAVRAQFSATVSNDQTNVVPNYSNVKITTFDKKGDRNATIFSGYINLHRNTNTNKDEIRLKITKSNNNNLPAKEYIIDQKVSGGSSGFVGEWKNTSSLNNPLVIDIKNATDDSVNFDIKVGTKVIFENVVTSNKTTLYGQFYNDNNYYSANVAVKGVLSDFDTFVSTGKFESTNKNEVTYDGVKYNLSNPEIVYAIAKKN